MHILSPKLTTALLESAGGREWLQKIFHYQPPWENVARLDWTRHLLVTSWVRIWLSHWGQSGPFATHNRTFLCKIYHVFPIRIIKPRYLFVCVEVLRPSKPNGVMSNAVSLPNHTLWRQFAWNVKSWFLEKLRKYNQSVSSSISPASGID